MKQRLLVAFFTIFVFAAGYRTGVWRELKRPVPAPPGLLGIEFGLPRSGGNPSRGDRPINRKDLIDRINSIKPQLDRFEARKAAIDDEFSKNLDRVLTPEQRILNEERAKRWANDSKSKRDSGPFLTDDEIASRLYDKPAHGLLWDVVIPFRLDVLTQSCKLDDAQREKVRALLKVRREELLELIDRSPPPSVSLVRLAPYVQRLAGPVPPPAPEPAAK